MKTNMLINHVKDRKKIRLSLVLSVLILICIEMVITVSSNIKKGDRTIEMLLSQVKNIFIENENRIELLTDNLKKDYIHRAKAVEYALKYNGTALKDVEELCNIAKITGVDEIHIINEDGDIFSGTIEKYYGLNLDSGEQIRYFLPMLVDYELELCQDMMPNTAENKQMMYAAVWNETREYIIQVGITPSTLLGELQQSAVIEVVGSMPMVDGVDIYVADNDTGTIAGATEQNAIGKNILDLCVDKSNKHWDRIHSETVGGKQVRCKFITYGKFDIGITYSMVAVNEGILLNFTIVTIYLTLALGTIFYVLNKIELNRSRAQKEIEKSREERDRQLYILTSMSEIYYTMHLIDLKNDIFKEYKTNENIKLHENAGISASRQIFEIMIERTHPDYKKYMEEFVNLDTLAERMMGKKTISMDFLGIRNKWMRASFISIENDSEGKCHQVIYTTQDIDEEKRREEMLIHESNTDELTGAYNRRAYENAIKQYEMTGIPKDFVLISMDVNGLKVTNDTLGHAVGDELLRGTVDCINRVFAKRGTIFRTGGDEFMIMINCSVQEVQRLIEQFQSMTSSWKGETLEHIAVSCGYAARIEEAESDVEALERIADERMYQNKKEYYQNKNFVN